MRKEIEDFRWDGNREESWEEEDMGRIIKKEETKKVLSAERVLRKEWK